MNKSILMNLLILTLLFGCQEPEPYTTPMPETMPPLFGVKIGLDPALKGEKIVFEKYLQTRMGTAVATKLYENGDYYRVMLGSGQSLKVDSIYWRKVGTISPSGIKRIEKISKTAVVDYLKKGPPDLVSMAMENVNWYFYFDHPKFAETQRRQWKLWQKPRFVGKIDRTIEGNLTYE